MLMSFIVFITYYPYIHITTKVVSSNLTHGEVYLI